MNIHNWNQHDLNRLCEKLLKQKGELSSEMNVNALDLVIWGLENPELTFLGPWKVYRWNLNEQAYQMMNWKPDNVMKLLGKDLDDEDLNGQGEIVYRQIKDLDTLDAAVILIENLYDNLQQLGPGFG